MKLPVGRMTWFLLALAFFAAGCTKTSSTTKDSPPAATNNGEPKPADTSAAALATPKGSLISLKSGNGDIQAYWSQPDGPGPFPGVVLVHEWWGLNQQIKTVADHLTKLGYAVIVPDLYHGNVTDDAEKAHELLRGLTDESALSDLTAAATRLTSSPVVGGRPIGVLGFCMGGRLALLLALTDQPIKAVVMFYGTPVTDKNELTKLSSPLLALFGADDQGITGPTIKQFQDDLTTLGKSVEVKVYDGAGHAFMNDARPSYRPEAAKDAWGRVENFFAAHLKS